MPKSPENFDFSKQKDIKRFKRLVPQSKEKIIAQSQDEAEDMRWEIESGFAENYDDAAEYVAIANQIQEIVNRAEIKAKEQLSEIQKKYSMETKKKRPDIVNFLKKNINLNYVFKLLVGVDLLLGALTLLTKY